ncbi:unnamed protein product [Xylocopa violacea]|uniref:Elongation of very long chain fatty acids protein n=1 Tax=Xylocopa violacea TaxID=135666 RepID=A0ABP1P359_XYLVO
MAVTRIYHYLNTDVADPRTKDWSLIDNPLIIVLLSSMYLYIVLRLGPRYMKNRPAYGLSTFIKFYNSFQIAANALVIYHTVAAGWFEINSWYCISADFARTPRNDKIIAMMWYLLLLKLVDYIETIVFVLRKKQRQVSFLHLYHHISTVLINWFIVKYQPHAMVMMVVVVNCGIHVIMYTYYLLASFGPSMQKLLNPVKPFITIMQIGQFIFLILHQMQSFTTDCTGVKLLSGMMNVNLTINLILFINFYRKNYTKKSKRQ